MNRIALELGGRALPRRPPTRIVTSDGPSAAPTVYPLDIPKDWSRTLRLCLLSALAAYSVAFTARAFIRGYSTFLADYVRWMVRNQTAVGAGVPTHIFVLFVDHFEPNSDPERVEDWARRYAALAARHHDADGRPPQHTWFYPGEQFSRPIHDTLRWLTASGLGEVELHYHHGGDTEQSLRENLRWAIASFNASGFLKTIDGKTAFAFVHGNSGLDNSNGDALCGVQREIALLHELGCFADFTFPSLFERSQPSRVNSIYATRDDDGPKSYERRLPLDALRDGSGQLMMFEGPLIFTPTWNPRQLFLHLEDGDLHGSEHATRARVDSWVRANVHVAERPDWLFVKLFAHGISSPDDAEAVLGDDFDDALSYFESDYDDGTRYVLHYITAREAYNLARAAGEGKRGDQSLYRDAYIQPYVAGSAVPRPVL